VTPVAACARLPFGRSHHVGEFAWRRRSVARCCESASAAVRSELTCKITIWSSRSPMQTGWFGRRIIVAIAAKTNDQTTWPRSAWRHRRWRQLSNILGRARWWTRREGCCHDGAHRRDKDCSHWTFVKFVTLQHRERIWCSLGNFLARKISKISLCDRRWPASAYMVTEFKRTVMAWDLHLGYNFLPIVVSRS